MRRPSFVLALGFLAALAMAAGCGPSAPTGPDPATGTTVRPAPGDHTVVFSGPGGAEASYVVHAPPRYSPATKVALVVVFHGSPGSPEGISAMSTMDEVADEHGFLVVYPDTITDPATVIALLDHAVPTWNVDPARTYAAGFSRGASTVYSLAEQYGDRFAAVAPVSGTGGTGSTGTPVSLITFQGGRDRLRPTFPQTNERWATAHRCAATTPQPAVVGEMAAHLSASVCAEGTEHLVYNVPEMGHDWPAAATSLIWEFFDRHSA